MGRESIPVAAIHRLVRYTQNGVLEMVERNAKIKSAPERWQDHTGHFDVVLTFEKHVYNEVLEELQVRAENDDGDTEPVFVVNLETRDKVEEAAQGAQLAYELCERVSDSPRPRFLPNHA